MKGCAGRIQCGKIGRGPPFSEHLAQPIAKVVTAAPRRLLLVTAVDLRGLRKKRDDDDDHGGADTAEAGREEKRVKAVHESNKIRRR
jgi:hypothetical protein